MACVDPILLSRNRLNPPTRKSVVAGMKLARWLIGISCAVGIVTLTPSLFPTAKPVAQHPEPQWSVIQLLLRLP